MNNSGVTCRGTASRLQQLTDVYPGAHVSLVGGACMQAMRHVHLNVSLRIAHAPAPRKRGSLATHARLHGQLDTIGENIVQSICLSICTFASCKNTTSAAVVGYERMLGILLIKPRFDDRLL